PHPSLSLSSLESEEIQEIPTETGPAADSVNANYPMIAQIEAWASGFKMWYLPQPDLTPKESQIKEMQQSPQAVRSKKVSRIIFTDEEIFTSEKSFNKPVVLIYAKSVKDIPRYRQKNLVAQKLLKLWRFILLTLSLPPLSTNSHKFSNSMESMGPLRRTQHELIVQKMTQASLIKQIPVFISNQKWSSSLLDLNHRNMKNDTLLAAKSIEKEAEKAEALDTSDAEEFSNLKRVAGRVLESRSKKARKIQPPTTSSSEDDD
ncbi:hypothetical protein Fcan01_28028, partial [Folsomia candida]